MATKHSVGSKQKVDSRMATGMVALPSYIYLEIVAKIVYIIS